MRQLLEIAEDARRAKYTVAKLGTNDKNRALLAIADALEARADEIIAANAVDIENGRAAGLNDGLIDRPTRSARCSGCASARTVSISVRSASRWA